MSNIRLSDTNGVRLITFDRREKKNALTQDMYAEVIKALTEGDKDPSVRVFVVTGAGDVFTSGNDLRDFGGSSGGGPAPGALFPSVLNALAKPIIAAVNGLALGVGVTMLPQCDLVYASAHATFRTPFVDLALIPEGCSSLLLPLAMGGAKASEMLLMGDDWTADEAERAGLVARVIPTDGFLDAVLARAQRLAAKAPSAVRQAKALLRIDRDPLEARIALTGRLFAERLASAEFGEAISTFSSRRPPDFTRFV